MFKGRQRYIKSFRWKLEKRIARVLNSCYPDKRKRILLWVIIPGLIKLNEHMLKYDGEELAEKIFNVCKEWLERNFEAYPSDNKPSDSQIRAWVRWWIKHWEERKARGVANVCWGVLRNAQG